MQRKNHYWKDIYQKIAGVISEDRITSDFFPIVFPEQFYAHLEFFSVNMIYISNWKKINFN